MRRGRGVGVMEGVDLEGKRGSGVEKGTVTMVGSV